MAKIFISYRRSDSQHAVDRLQDVIRPYLKDPKNDLFVDIDNIPAGVDFAEHLRNTIDRCDAVLVIIGPQWLDARTPEGVRRLDQPDDFVRAEIAASLARQIAVIPVLLDGTPMPQAGSLPEDLQALTARNAVQLDRKSFRADVRHLMSGLGIKAKRRGGLLRTVLFAAALPLAGFGAYQTGLLDPVLEASGITQTSTYGRWDEIPEQSWSNAEDQALIRAALSEASPAQVVAAARAGSANAQVIAGILYQYGSPDLDRDQARAGELYAEACDAGYMRGCTNLGALHYYGTGVPQNYVVARRLFSEACDGNNAMGCLNLGLQFHVGQGGEQNSAEARRLYKKACDRGHETGCQALSMMSDE